MLSLDHYILDQRHLESDFLIIWYSKQVQVMHEVLNDGVSTHFVR